MPSFHYGRNSFATLAAAGAAQGTAGAIVTDAVNVTSADGAKGVRLPVPKAGDRPEPILVVNAEAAQALLVYPHSGGKINAGSDNAALTLGGGVSMSFTPVSATEWYTDTTFVAASVAAGVAGTVEASKAVVVDGNKDAATFRNLTATNFDAGSSGVVGTVDVFPATASKGKLAITKSNNTNNDTSTLNVAAMGQATTITLPDPGGAAASIVLTEGAQTINGVKTFGSAIVQPSIDAGASGTAGDIDVFPTTALSGKLTITCSDQPADHQVIVNAASMAATRTLTLADPLASCDFILGKMATVARTATNDGLTTGTIAAAGMIQHVTVTSANSAHIIVLPTPTPGRIVILAVGSNGYELRSSTPASVAISGGTGASAQSAIPANSTAVLFCETATSWKGLTFASNGALAQVEAAA